jgi:hypothetical protein
MRWRRPVISGYIVFHFSLILCWLFAPRDYKEYAEQFAQYIFFLGLDQNFAMFAPNPPSRNASLLAIITYENGETKLWFYPRMERLGILERMGKERYRKFFNDNFAFNNVPEQQRDLARFIARNNNNYPNNKPMMVTLMRYHCDIPPPSIGLGKPLPRLSEAKVLISYPVTSEDLQ